MVSLTRLINWIALLVGSLLFLVLQGEVDLTQRIAGGTVLLALASLLIFTGREKMIIPVMESPQTSEPSPEPSPEPELKQLEDESVELSDTEETEMRRSRGRLTTSPTMPLPPLPVMMPPPSLPVMVPPTASPQFSEGNIVTDPSPILPEGTNIAMKYVAKGDAVSDEEEEIEGFIAQRREKRDKMLSDIERRRRMKLAERKASMARKWSEAEDGEDLATLLRGGEHDIQVFEEPENPDTGKPLGITYFRIDSDRVLMIRAPLEIPQKGIPSTVDDNPTDTQPILPPGMPPLPPPGMPPLPPPGMPPLPPVVNSEDGQ
tara:strand:+ start:5894 stop:6847 length:954 start_codon:yes stop_codon:yes gene_type:complete